MTLNKSIEQLKNFVEAQNNKYKNQLFDTIKKVSSQKQMNYPNPQQKNIFIIKKSELGNIWNVEYHSWEITANKLLRKFQNMDLFQCIDYLNQLYTQRIKNNVTYIKEGKNNITIDALFIKEILVQLGYKV
jgi:hypothetical protein